DGIRDPLVTGVQTCALPICRWANNQLLVEWGVSHRAYAGTLFDSGEQRLTHSLPDPAAARTCTPQISNPWSVHTSVESTGRVRRSEERRVGRRRRARAWAYD